MSRTVQDFVEDMVSDCKSLNEILIVTENCRWRSQREEVIKEYKALKSRRV